jgi:hypothetical protein
MFNTNNFLTPNGMIMPIAGIGVPFDGATAATLAEATT